MTILNWCILYLLALALTFGLSKLLPRDSRAGKYSSRAFTTLTLGLLKLAQVGLEKIGAMGEEKP
jgi:hypothetical protein